MFRKTLATVVAFVLFASGLIHAAQPYYFVHSVAAYRLVSGVFLDVAVVIPYLQIVLALGLFFDSAPLASATLSAALFGMFSLAQTIAIIRGDSLSCGCFGRGSLDVSLFSLAIPLLCAASCIIMIKLHLKSQQGQAIAIQG